MAYNGFSDHIAGCSEAGYVFEKTYFGIARATLTCAGRMTLSPI